MEIRRIPLVELCESITDCPHSTPEWTESGNIVIRNQNIKNGRLDLSSPSYTNDEDFLKRLTRAKPAAGDIIITREAPMGEVCLVPQNLQCCLGQRMVLLKPDRAKVNGTYLLYALMSRDVQFQISWSDGTGTTVSNLRIPHLCQLKIPCPDIAYQNRIATMISAIDGRIENNWRINDNLEQQAVAMFREIFITQADPSWAEGTISDLGTVVGGSTPSKAKPEYYTEHGIAWITPKDLSVNKSKFISHGADDITELGLRNSSATIMPAGTVLFSSRAPIGYIAIADSDVTTNQGFKSVVPRAHVGTAFVYYFLKSAFPIIEGMASGSTFKEISGSAMRTVPAIIPDEATLRTFSSFCDPLFRQQRTLEKQNRELAAMRDTLLPKLMSGEVDVSAVVL